MWGMVFGCRKERIRGSGLWLLREKKKNPRGGVGGWRLSSGPGEEKNLRVSVFCVFDSLSPKLPNDPPPLLLSFEPIFIGKLLSGTPNWSLNFFLFCKFDSFLIFCIF